MVTDFTFTLNLEYPIIFQRKGYRKTLFCIRAAQEVDIPVLTLDARRDKFPVIRKATGVFDVMPGVRTRHDFEHAGNHTERRKMTVAVRKHNGAEYHVAYHHRGADAVSEFPAAWSEYVMNVLECTAHAKYVSTPDSIRSMGDCNSIPSDATTIVTGTGYDLQDAIAHSKSFADRFIIYNVDGELQLWERFDKDVAHPFDCIK